MARTIISLEGADVTTGYLIVSTLSVMLFTLFFKDPMYLVFAIPLVLLFSLGSSIDSGDPDEDLGALGWSSENMELAVPLGMAGGILGIFLGGLIVKYSTETTATIVPDFSAAGFLTTATVIPAVLAIAANIFGQWTVVAPSEEALARVLAPYAGRAIFKNWTIAFIFGALFWTTIHIPTYVAQAVGISMYFVLLILAGITVGVYLITKNLIAAIITHGTFNTGVIILGVGIDAATFYVLAVIAIILTYAYLNGLIESNHKRC